MLSNQSVKTIDSREVAKMVDKQHKELLRDIRKYVSVLTSANLRSTEYFIPSEYEDLKKEVRPCYELTKQGCELVGNKLTGNKGITFTAMYVSKFNEMEVIISSPTGNIETTEDIMIATLQNIKSVKQDMNTVKSDIVGLKQEIDLNRQQKKELSDLVKHNVMKAVGGKKSQAYKALYRVGIAEHWREIKNYFGVASYEEIPKLRFNESLELARCWSPSAELALEIKQVNNQQLQIA